MYKVRGIIFDLDGTLVDLPIDWHRVIRQVERILGVKVKSLLELYPKTWGTEKYKLISQTVEEFEFASLDKLKVLDNSVELLMELSPKYLIGIATFQGENVVKKIFDRLGTRNLVLATRDDAPTKIKQISHIISSTSLEPEDFLVVGDRLNDVYSALDLGCQAILVDRRNKFDPNKIRENITIIPNLAELLNLFKE